jgi:hypothetical protein
VTSTQLALAAMALGGRKACLTDTQVRILLFLLDVEASHLFGGPHFHWDPGPFGPSSPAVFAMLDELSDRGSVVVSRLGRRNRVFRLAETGLASGTLELSGLGESRRDYLSQMVTWLKSVDSLTLVEDEVPRRYPEMVRGWSRPVCEN